MSYPYLPVIWVVVALVWNIRTVPNLLSGDSNLIETTHNWQKPPLRTMKQSKCNQNIDLKSWWMTKNTPYQMLKDNKLWMRKSFAITFSIFFSKDCWLGKLQFFLQLTTFPWIQPNKINLFENHKTSLWRLIKTFIWLQLDCVLYFISHF